MKSESSGDVQHFLVSELLPFIPPAISAQSGIPMEKEVAIPVPADGGRDIELSSLYLICPELFATEITPLNDSVITLPTRLGSIGSLPEPSLPFAAPTTSAQVSPTGCTPTIFSPKRGPSGEEEGANPFWSGPASSAPPKQVVTGAKGFGSGFQDPSDKVDGSEGFGFSPEVSDPEKQFGETAPGPVGNSSPGDPGPGEKEEEPVFGFGSSFMGDTANPFDSSEGFATLFSRQARADEDIPYPGLPVDPDTEEGGTKNFDGPAESQEPAAAKEDTAGPGLSEPTGFLPRTASEAHHFPEMSMDHHAGMHSTKRDRERNEKTGAGPVEKAPLADLFPDLPAENSTQPGETPPEKKPSAERKGEAERPIPEAARGGMDDLLRDLEFRAIFSISEPFTLSKVARCIVGLPGIGGCALATPDKIVQATKGEEGRPGEEAREMVDSIRNLARLSGMPEAKSFTLHTDRGAVSLFVEGKCCVTIHLDGETFAPGVQEKLILIAKSIHKLEE